YLQGVLGAVVRFTGAGIPLHLLFAALVALHVTLLAARILRFHRNQAKLFRPAVLLGGLLILQLVLGLGSYLVKFTSIGTLLPALPVVILRTTHVVTGALMLVTGLLLTLRSYRLLAHPHPLLGRQLLSEQIPA
ncbi:MAG: hypothetical protein AAB279_06870, partial [Candidatus Binatota bacterium]